MIDCPLYLQTVTGDGFQRKRSRYEDTEDISSVSPIKIQDVSEVLGLFDEDMALMPCGHANLPPGFEPGSLMHHTMASHTSLSSDHVPFGTGHKSTQEDKQMFTIPVCVIKVLAKNGAGGFVLKSLSAYVKQVR
jgi:hypothetical protein